MQDRQLYLIPFVDIWNYRGYDVQFVSNFTDVDDKLITAAKELGEDVPTIAERFIEAYFEDVSALGLQKSRCSSTRNGKYGYHH